MSRSFIDCDKDDQREGLDIAVIGMAGRFPGSPDLDAFWRNLCAGVESVSRLTPQELAEAGVDRETAGRSNYVGARAVLDGIELFDAPFFGMTPKEAEMTDPQQRLLLECAWETLEHAGYDPSRYKGSIGVYAGSSTSGYLYHLFPRRVLLQSPAELSAMLGVEKDSLATRLSYKLNLRGPSLAVQTACSTSLVAVHLACQALLSGECDMALAGGVSVTVPQKVGYLYQEGGIVSPDGHCRTFDAKAEGTLGGSGVGLVLLKRLQEATEDGDHILAVIKGSAVNNDGAAKVGYTAPSIEGQAQVIKAAHVAAGVDAESISYIEAHGTGTPMGDPIEVAALTEAFRVSTNKSEFCAIGSVKTNIGHLDAAAGVAGLIKTVLALVHRRIPASLHYTAPNPAIPFSTTPFYVNTVLTEWNSGASPRRAGVSSFGLGGTNAHVVLEEAPAVTTLPASAGERWRLLILSACSTAALERTSERLAEHLVAVPNMDLEDVAFTLQRGRKVFPHRRWVVAKTAEEARQALVAPLIMSGTVGPVGGERRVAFMFSGQGAQYPHMGRSFYDQEPRFRQAVDQCAALLTRHLGRDIREILFPRSAGDAELIHRTAMTQPALFVLEYALAQTWMSWGLFPAAMIGHSIGEYVAACLSGVFTLDDALAIVAMRGRLMQALPAGGMAAVPLTEAELLPLLPAGLDLAAVNAPAQCVVSGPHERLKAFERTLADGGITMRRLMTSHAFHSSMMEPMLARFEAFLAGMTTQEPRIPWVSNLTGTWIRREDVVDPAYWSRHLRSTIRFSDGLRTLFNDQPVLLEVGPGRTLQTLSQRHPGAATVPSFSSFTGREQDEMAGMLMTLGALWGAGVPVEWNGLQGERRPRRVPLPSYPFERQRYWLEPRQEQPISVSAGGRRADLSQWFYQPSWKRSALVRTSVQRSDGPWVVFVGDRPTESVLRSQLESRVGSITAVFPGASFERLAGGSYRVRPDSRDDHESLLRDLADRGLAPGCLLHAWTIESMETETSAEMRMRTAQERGFLHLQILAQTFGERRGGRLSILVLTQGLHDVTGDERLRPEWATLLGACLVMPQEYPSLSCRLLDVDRTVFEQPFLNVLGERLTAEAVSPRLDTVVAYRGRHRWVRTFEPLRLDAADTGRSPFREGGVCLITGGLGGVGLCLAEQFHRTRRAKLVLVGRSRPTAEQREAVSRLERSGGEVLLCQADVADPAQMRAVIDKACDRFGGIHAVVHAAGVAGGGLLALKTPTAVREEFRAKVDGGAVLATLFRDRPLDLLLLCSSLTAVVGGIGQSAYCAANAYLDALAHAEQKEGRRVMSVNFDRWRRIGMAVHAEAVLLTMGVGESELDGMTAAEGQETLHRILQGPDVAQVTQSIRDLSAVIAAVPQLSQLDRHAQSQAERAEGVATASVAAAGGEGVEQQLTAVWRQILGREQVGSEEDFFQLGGESLTALQILNRTQELYHVAVSLSEFLAAPTIIGLAGQIRAAQSTGGRQEQVIVPVPREGRRLRGVSA